MRRCRSVGVAVPVSAPVSALRLNHWKPACSPVHYRHMAIRIQCLCIDTAAPARIASFWESALGWRRTWTEEDQVCLEPPAGSAEEGIAPDLVFLRVPDSTMTSFPAT